MGSILIALPKRENADHIASILRQNGMQYDIVICSSSSEILREANDRDYGTVISTPNLQGMGYLELSEYLPSNFGLIIMTKNVNLELVSDRMLKLILPFRAGELTATIEMMMSGLYRPRRRKKPIPPKRSPEEQKIVDEAKALLMDRQAMSEQEAFRYIQKNSMDSGRTMLESAQMILLLNNDWNH